MRMFGRKVRVVVGKPGEQGAEWDGLRVSFRVEKTSTSEPDKAEVQIYNLSNSSRSQAETEGVRVWLYAGYIRPSLIFSGDISAVEHAHAVPDIISTIEAEDGGQSWSARMQETIRGPIDGQVIIRRIADAMGATIAYIDPDLDPFKVEGSYSISGPVRDSLSRIVRSMGGTWSLQDGALVIAKSGAPSARTGPVISPATGLIGSAEKTDEGVRVTSLIQPAIAPNGVFRVESKTVTGWFRAIHVLHIGDNGWEQPFYTELEGVEYNHV